MTSHIVCLMYVGPDDKSSSSSDSDDDDADDQPQGEANDGETHEQKIGTVPRRFSNVRTKTKPIPPQISLFIFRSTNRYAYMHHN